jgi:aldehyde:ferredoxin oxidoreductase
MYNIDLTQEDVINIGKQILKNEIEFNKRAGISQEMNDLPDFFRKEPSDPVELVVDFPKEELNNFWNRLEE